MPVRCSNPRRRSNASELSRLISRQVGSKIDRHGLRRRAFESARFIIDASS
jgi:hypothetical protein